MKAASQRAQGASRERGKVKRGATARGRNRRHQRKSRRRRHLIQTSTLLSGAHLIPATLLIEKQLRAKDDFASDSREQHCHRVALHGTSPNLTLPLPEPDDDDGDDGLSLPGLTSYSGSTPASESALICPVSGCDCVEQNCRSSQMTSKSG